MATYTAPYKGHTIVVKNPPLSALKQLVIDDELQDVSGMLFESGTLMWGRIKSGDGGGDIIKVRLAYRCFSTQCCVFANDTLIFKS